MPNPVFSLKIIFRFCSFPFRNCRKGAKNLFFRSLPDKIKAYQKRRFSEMEQNEEKLVEEIRKAVADCVSMKKGGKTPIEKRWNLPEKEKPVEA